MTIHNEGTGLDTPLTSNDTGAYSAPYLQPGTYDITVSKSGFAQQVFGNEVNQKHRANSA